MPAEDLELELSDSLKPTPDAAMGCCDGGCSACDPCWCPTWSITAGALLMERSTPQHPVLVTNSLAPGGSPQIDADAFDFAFRGGFELSLFRSHVRGSDFEFQARYFRVDGWDSSHSPFISADGSAVQYATSFGVTGTPSELSAVYISHLDGVELNLRRPVGDGWLTVFGGFRFLELDERLTIVQDIGPGVNLATNRIEAVNDLYGFQIGADGRLLTRGQLGIDATLKAGIFGNHAANSVAIRQTAGADFDSRAGDGTTAFVGELGVSAIYCLCEGVAFRAGYQLMWLDGIAEAADQIAVSDPLAGTATIDSGDSAVYEGVFMSLEFCR